MERRAAPVLAELGLEVPRTPGARRCSLADQQLLEIGRALLRDPAVLILDEPTSALPQEAVARLAARPSGCPSAASRCSTSRTSLRRCCGSRSG